MKKVYIIRHAKSSWEEPWSNDHDRPLAPRGLRDAPRMGKHLKSNSIFPDKISSSTALRAKKTAKIIAKELSYPLDKIEFEKGLYHASAHTYLDFIQHQEDEINCLFLIGHNPGMNGLIHLLGVALDNLPTAGICGFQTEAKSWADFKPENAKFIYLDYPKKKA
ncbi:MAG: histidine phosphatase family protein [Algoriphagus sp.]|uniref:SixA phosphatase family protein n=1 Tax=Algoriphagus sp. TaxID=1872435 RepID=UPI001846432A|nr:histidine phosphatase family protein [Algoriphagus sp.]NVJ85941.1 histidine phosphatase family protein [Algoriphagus sp.]